MQDAASVLQIPAETLQAWVDFLVEEKILGIEYKFTKPYIYLNKETSKKPGRREQQKEKITLEQLKQEYLVHAREKQLPADAILSLWKSHVSEALDAKKEYFLQQAASRGLANPHALWERYVQT
ncbi:MAG TPA: hypothetical protein VLA12_03640, partial [Planctomycetaceae bacterium]|nr:hypothetical protein [Planctomycetaceae bacterium]